MSGLIAYDFNVLDPDPVFCKSLINAETRLSDLIFNLVFFLLTFKCLLFIVFQVWILKTVSGILEILQITVIINPSLILLSAVIQIWGIQRNPSAVHAGFSTKVGTCSWSGILMLTRLRGCPANQLQGCFLFALVCF